MKTDDKAHRDDKELTGVELPVDPAKTPEPPNAATVAPYPKGVLPETPAPMIVNRPWGSEIWWAFTTNYCGKKLFVKAGHRLSMQYHEVKTETMLCESGEGVLEINGVAVKFKPGMLQYVPAGVVHRLIAVTDMVVLETSTTEVDDVVRLEDDYGRVGNCEADCAPGGDPGREGGSGKLNGGG